MIDFLLTMTRESSASTITNSYRKGDCKTLNCTILVPMVFDTFNSFYTARKTGVLFLGYAFSFLLNKLLHLIFCVIHQHEIE